MVSQARSCVHGSSSLCVHCEATHKVRQPLDSIGALLVAVLFAAGVTPAAYGCGERFGFPVTAVVNESVDMGFRWLVRR